jgi:hypothetical protein
MASYRQGSGKSLEEIFLGLVGAGELERRELDWIVGGA